MMAAWINSRDSGVIVEIGRSSQFGAMLLQILLMDWYEVQEKSRITRRFVLSTEQSSGWWHHLLKWEPIIEEISINY